MKVLWVEDHARAGELLAAAAAAASRRRFGIDLVIATSLLDAERKLRLERFDLVVIDLMLLPDSADEQATVTRIASMGKFRVAIVLRPASVADEVMKSLVPAGVDCAPKAVGKGRAAARRIRAQARTVPRLPAGANARSANSPQNPAAG